MRIAGIATLAILLAVAACDRSENAPGGSGTTAAPAFTHSMGSDLSGYYRPATEVRIGRWSLDHVFVGQTAEFQAWESGGRNETFAPVMLQFEDTASPMVADKLGGSVEHTITARVLPTAYSVTDTSLSFEGRSPELGAVGFEGSLDPGALATSRRNLGSEGVVVTGTLKVGNDPARAVQLRWWGGD